MRRLNRNQVAEILTLMRCLLRLSDIRCRAVQLEIKCTLTILCDLRWRVNVVAQVPAAHVFNICTGGISAVDCLKRQRLSFYDKKEEHEVIRTVNREVNIN